MAAKPTLKKILIDMSGVCSGCGDLLFTPPRSAEEPQLTVEQVREVLDRIFKNHIAQNHPDHEQYSERLPERPASQS
jgi:hypothetical protein